MPADERGAAGVGVSTVRVWNPGDSPVLPPADEDGYSPDSVPLPVI